MRQSIEIKLPDETRIALNRAAGEEGLSESALIEKALTDYLFLRQFRTSVSEWWQETRRPPIRKSSISSREERP